MAIDYSQANLAWDAKCAEEEAWMKEHADRICGECKHYIPAPCECSCGWCTDSEDFTEAECTVKYLDCYGWKER